LETIVYCFALLSKCELVIGHGTAASLYYITLSKSQHILGLLKIEISVASYPLEQNEVQNV
jgi:hypothetical protein